MGMTIGDFIRKMSDGMLAQFLIDVAYENAILEKGEVHLIIPSPLGGYLVDGAVDFHDWDVVTEALQEEVDDGNDNYHN